MNLEERIATLTSNYGRMFEERGRFATPSDPLEFHLHHLARYWSRLGGFCRQTPSKPEGWIDGDLGACVAVGTEFADKLIVKIPNFQLWQEYQIQTHAVLHVRPVTLEQVESALRAFDACLAGMKYGPWPIPTSNPPKLN